MNDIDLRFFGTNAPAPEELANKMIAKALQIRLQEQLGQDWTEEWQAGEFSPWDTETVNWLRTRSPKVQELMTRFPEGSLVRTISGFETNIPAPGTLGIVVTWHTFVYGMCVGVIQCPGARMEKVIPEHLLEVVGYHHGETPERIREMLRLFEEGRGTEGKEGVAKTETD